MGIWSLLGLEGPLDASGEGYEPSPVALVLAVEKKTNYAPITFAKKYTGDKKILVVCTEHRQLTMANGKKFSTGNHPVETILPLLHLTNAGFDFDVATPTGKPAIFEEWALPTKDPVVTSFYTDVAKPKFDAPMSSLVALAADPSALDAYLCLFIPGGHGAVIGLPEDPALGKILETFYRSDRFVTSICHGPAAFLATQAEPHIFAGYRIACFPDAVDKQTPMIGYMPGPMPWLVQEGLEKKGLVVVNKGADDTVERDRKVVTGASPKASNNLGKKVAEVLLEEYA
eukprot:CAMPEP_0174889662 /NCGR_PEP_ID=MMETSP0167-20121228/4863_1 /TAXON_ID=38298 /ORGANISM="Rhodella maculata, Strain CCMP736" /LENGTH=285 /DNA_ID=CAMNT_0016127139 /DNA_START=167 /DNA_END=1024 /DNA_ORIENTATION=+